MRMLLQRVAAWCRGQGGMTLVEVIIAVGIITAGAAMVGPPMFAVLQQNQSWQDNLTATESWRQAAGYFSRDVEQAQTISLADGSPSVDSITMTWSLNGATQTVDYALSTSTADETLQRTFNGSTIAVARGVESVQFGRSGDMLTMTLTMKHSTAPVQALAALRSLN